MVPISFECVECVECVDADAEQLIGFLSSSF